eukprot:GEMP01036213.1.p1 GENE.GEMP01036213.1~~GEMP01036213.1.p1  ORF type:complete len:417 (+),score=95.33 GEMP01036213.1:47-1297(+)
MADDENLPDFEPVDDDEKSDAGTKKAGGAVSALGFRDFLLKAELMKALVDSGFEHPSEVQHECLPQAILGSDVLCQAKSGMGKTAVFVLTCLQLVDLSKSKTKVLVLCHSRELAYQIQSEFERFAKRFPEPPVTMVVYGGIPIQKNKEMLQKKTPHILVGTPGRVLQLVREKDVDFSEVAHFVLDECDKCLEELAIRQDVQKIFIETPRKKQVMMFSATTGDEIRVICKKFMAEPFEIVIDEAKLTLHGLQQYYVKLDEAEKIRKLISFLDNLEFNQVIIYMGTVQRARTLDKVLTEVNFPSLAIYSGLSQEERINRLQLFKDFKKRILITTDLVGRGIDIERVNIVINYDMPKDENRYLHRVGRAGRFGTKGLAITFVASEKDTEVLNSVQKRFEVALSEAPMPEQIDTSSYLNA